MASREAEKTAKVTKFLPNKRERAAAQFGQLNDLTSTYWDTATPETIQEAIERIAAQVYALGTNTPIP